MHHNARVAAPFLFSPFFRGVVALRPEIWLSPKFQKTDLYYDGTLSLEGLSEEAIAVPSAEEGYIAEIDLSERQLLRKLLLQGMGDKLTELQRTRLWLYCVDGLSEQAIAEKQGVDQQRVSKSIVAAKKKLKKFLTKRG